MTQPLLALVSVCNFKTPKNRYWVWRLKPGKFAIFPKEYYWIVVADMQNQVFLLQFQSSNLICLLDGYLKAGNCELCTLHFHTTFLANHVIHVFKFTRSFYIKLLKQLFKLFFWMAKTIVNIQVAPATLSFPRLNSSFTVSSLIRNQAKRGQLGDQIMIKLSSYTTKFVQAS